MSIASELGYEPENSVCLTGRLVWRSELKKAAFGGELLLITLEVPRLHGRGDQSDRIDCYAINDDAAEMDGIAEVDDVLHVEGEIRINPKTRAAGVKIFRWWLDDDEELPLDGAGQVIELSKLEEERIRNATAIDGILPPEEMTLRESAAWITARFRGEGWEMRWKEEHGVEAAEDEGISRVYALLRDHWSVGEASGGDADPGDAGGRAPRRSRFATGRASCT